jgi:XTP/dITP diphosphohydrolase
LTTELVLATQNGGKLAEFRDILDGLDVVLLSAADLDLPPVDETGDSFRANALLKAKAGVVASGLPCVADDSGLVVDALDGAPGIYSARFAAMNGIPSRGQNADQDNMDLLLHRMKDVPDNRRTARFVCAAVLALPDDTHEVAEAAVEGTLIRRARGTGGFGYDPLFVPEGHTMTTAEMTQTEKHALSHRGKAFRALRPAISNNL